jgi:AcrR family transcriptional regulator
VVNNRLPKESSRLPAGNEPTEQHTTLSREPGTRERIISEAIALFAARGFRGTTVGDIEAAAGLSPRSGGLYKHFKSKEEVLEAVIERHVGEIEAMRPALEMLPLGDLRAELTLVGRWALAELKAEQELMRIVQKDGDQFPELVAEVHDRIIDRGEAQAVELIARIAQQYDVGVEDPRALAMVALESLVGYRVEERMFGVPPAGIGEDEFIEAWVDVWATYVDANVRQKVG